MLADLLNKALTSFACMFWFTHFRSCHNTLEKYSFLISSYLRGYVGIFTEDKAGNSLEI